MSSEKKAYTLRRVRVPTRKYTPSDYPTDDEVTEEDLEAMSSSAFFTSDEEDESTSLSGFIVSDEDEEEARDTLLRLKKVLGRKRPVYITGTNSDDEEGDLDEDDSFYYYEEEEEEDETWQDSTEEDKSESISSSSESVLVSDASGLTS
jgi:hypothetical protein